MRKLKNSVLRAPRMRAGMTPKLLATVALLGAAASIAGLGTGASPIAAGDTMQRAIDLSYSGTISFGSATLTTNATSSSLLDTDATNGLQLAIDKCSQAWTESGPPYTYTCGGSTSTVLASRALIGSSIALSNLTLTAGSTDHLRVTVSFPSAAGNTLQNQSSTIDYTFTGVQRAGANQ